MTAPITVTEAPLDAAAIRAEALDPRAGAVVLFEGCARDSHQGRAVALLAYEAFVPMAEAELGRLRDEAMAQFGLVRCLIHHRLGEVPLLSRSDNLPHRLVVPSGFLRNRKIEPLEHDGQRHERKKQQRPHHRAALEKNLNHDKWSF